MDQFEDAFNASGRRSRNRGGQSGGNRRHGNRSGGRGMAIVLPGAPACDCAQCMQSCSNPQAIALASNQPMTPVAAKMMADQAAQVAADAAAKAAALNQTPGPVSTVAKALGIDGFDNASGKKMKPKTQIIMGIAFVTVIVLSVIAYKKFKKVK